MVDYLNQNQGINLIVRLFKDGTLIPIFGAGISKGYQAHDGKVPDGNEAKKLMMELIVKHSIDTTIDDLRNESFNDLSTIFFEEVDKSIRTKFFIDYFTDVKISGEIQHFLNLDWPYAYTLNIDNGIENSNTGFHVLLPYKKLNSAPIKRLYKLHGDAEYEIKYQVDKNIIFSSEQYIKSIVSTDNQDFLDNLLGDFTGKNILFIGCSLKSESDLEFVVAKAQEDNFGNDDGRKGTYRIFLHDKHLSKIEETKVQKRYGINTIILVNNYDAFYKGVNERLNDYSIKNVIDNYFYKNPQIKIYNNDEKRAFAFLSGQELFNTKNNSFCMSDLRVNRSVIQEIITLLEKKNCVVIKGRRFSGKTIVLSLLCEKLKKYTIYYFPSSITPDETAVEELFINNNHTLFIFDSNSISDPVHYFLADSSELLNKNKNKLVIAVNSNDNYIGRKLEAEFIEIPNRFNQDFELPFFNHQVNQYGLLKRKDINTNFDYVKYISARQNIDLPIFSDRRYTGDSITSLDDKTIILLLCAVDKLYLSEVLALNIRKSKVLGLEQQFPLLIEELDVDHNIERNIPSSRKIVHNSKLVLLSMVDSFTDEEVIKIVSNVVKRLKNNYNHKRLYREIMMFDTLNQLFHHKHGAGNLIFKIYEKLERWLSDNPHFWLQRAKSIYRLKYNDEQELCNAQKYAMKAYQDGRDGTQSKAALSLSIIYFNLYNISAQKEDFEDAIRYFYEAFNSDEYRKNLSREGEIFYRKIVELCDKYVDSRNAEDVQDKAKYLIEYFKTKKS